MGKSLYVSRLAKGLQDHLGVSDVYVTIPLHGPVVTLDSVLELFKDHTMNPKCCIYHLDIAPNVRITKRSDYSGFNSYSVGKLVFRLSQLLPL